MVSYSDVKTRLCDKCSKLIDSRLRFPCVRKEKVINDDKPEEKKLKWLAYHEYCV